LLCSKQQWQQHSCNCSSSIAAVFAMQLGMVSQQYDCEEKTIIQVTKAIAMGLSMVAALQQLLLHCW